MVGMLQELGGEDLFVALSDPVLLELNRLQNQLREKDRELGASHSEIKALKATEALKAKAIEELRNEVNKLDEKLRVTESHLEQKNLECKKLTNEKKDALAAQFSAEATLRRLYADQKDDNSVPIGSVIAPLEADIKIHRAEIAALQEDKKALERLTKSKELALLEADRILQSALDRALIVEEVQNQNFDLKRQIEICQEENRILDKTNRQKVLEVQKLTKTIEELEEAVLAGGTAANAIRDYRRQISELNEEKKTLERELARVKVSANRVATVVVNEWKDGNDKLMPVKQWLEERRLLQAEMQKLRDKLAASEKTAKAEAQLKDKFRLRLKTLEEGLKLVSTFPANPKPRASTINISSPLQHQYTENLNVGGQLKHVDMFKNKYVSGENMPRKRQWTSVHRFADSGGKENSEIMANADVNIDKSEGDTAVPAEVKATGGGNENKGSANPESEDVVSGYLYDRLQREVLNLRKFCEMQDRNLNAKDEEIQMLVRKVDALTKSIEVESKKMRREATAREKEAVSVKVDDNRKTINAKRVTKAS